MKKIYNTTILLFLLINAGIVHSKTISNFPYLMDFGSLQPLGHYEEFVGNGWSLAGLHVSDIDLLVYNLQGWNTKNWHKDNSVFIEVDVSGGLYLESGNADNYILSPALDLSSLESPCLTFFTNNGSNAIEVLVSSTGTADGDFIVLATLDKSVYMNTIRLKQDVKYVKCKILADEINQYNSASFNGIRIFDEKEYVISSFPYSESFETPESLFGWTGRGIIREEIPSFAPIGRDGDYMLVLNRRARIGLSSYLISPELDLSKTSNPYFTFHSNLHYSPNLFSESCYISTSEDGENFALLKELKGDANNNLEAIEIPKTTKYIKIQPEFSENNLYFDYFKIEDKEDSNSISGSSISETSVYPNPVSDILYIENEELQLKAIELTDTNGKVYIKKQAKEAVSLSQVDVSGLPSGIYFIKMQYVEGIKTAKIIKR